MRRNILVVSSNSNALSAVVGVLTNAGYRARGALTFEEAKRQMTAKLPDLLIADERLGAYNGMHLILRGRADHPGMVGIVTSVAEDAALDAEARRLNIDCLVWPANPVDLLQPISNIFENHYAA